MTRALRGAIAAGIKIQRVEIDEAGKIILIMNMYDDELDQELAEFKARHRQD